MEELFKSWQEDSEFKGLNLTSKAKVYLNYFDKELADDEFRGLPRETQRKVKTNFLHEQDVDLGALDTIKDPRTLAKSTAEATGLKYTGEEWVTGKVPSLIKKEYAPIKGAFTLGLAATRVPQELISSVLSAIRGGKIKVDRGWSAEFMERTKKSAEEFTRKYGTKQQIAPGITVEDATRLPGNLGFTLTSALVGLGVGLPLSAIPGVGVPTAVFTGTAAVSIAAYRMAKDQFTNDIFNMVNQASIRNRGRKLTQNEWNLISERYENKAIKYGLWEAIPEALGQAATLGILKLPIGKFLKVPAVKNRLVRTLASAAAKFAGIQAEEQFTETITQYGQAGLEAEAGLREKPTTFTEAFKEQYPHTALLAGVTAGGGAVAVKSYERIRRLIPEPEPTVIEPTEVTVPEEAPPVVPRDEAIKQDFLANIAEYVKTGEIGSAEVAFMGKNPEVQALGISQEELNAVLGKVIGDAVIAPVVEDMAESQDRALEKFWDEVEEEAGLEVLPEPEKVAPREPTEREAAVLERIEPLEVEVVEPEEVKPRLRKAEPVYQAVKPREEPVPVVRKRKGEPAEFILSEELAKEKAPWEEEIPTAKEIDKAAKETETEPTEAQIEAGNYKKGHISLYGLDISIENPKGSVRTGVDRKGREWSIELKHHYGYIKETKGKDKDHLDVFIGSKPESDKVFVVDQIVPETGKFDEHKIMMGFETEQEAQAGYLANYEKGWKGLGTITEVTIDQFKEWTKTGDTTKAIGKIPEITPPEAEIKPPVKEKVEEVVEEVVEPIPPTLEKPEPVREGLIGVNEAGQNVYEDKDGNRYLVEKGFKISASRPVTPKGKAAPRTPKELFERHSTEYLTKEELGGFKEEPKPIPPTKPSKALEEILEEEVEEKKLELTKAPKEPIVKKEEGEERAEEEPRILREPGEEPLEGAPPEYVSGVREERAPGERPPTRPEEDFGGYDESDIRARPEGVRGLGDGEGKIRPSAERGRPAELGRQHASGRNYRITDADALEEGGAVAKYDRNITAIKLLKAIEGENRAATPEEQVTLAKYVSWGGLSEVFKGPTWKETPWTKRAKKLEDLLTEEEYESARASTPNAHFTSPLVINHIYDALKWMGFDGGRIVEPSMGIGHFFGRMPGDWRTKLVGIELDSISGRIAKLLYPDADVRIQGYEKTKLPNNFFDLAVSNVPFGDYKIFDPDYARLNFFIHDYFFAKSLDKVRPGGLVAFITSSGMMNKKDKRIRRYIAERAELIGAIRLPNNAFKKIANTEVTTDIIFLRKLREGEKAKGAAWLETKPWKIPGEEIPINEYFHDNPQMQLGKVVMDKLHYGRAGLESDGRDLGEALKSVIETMPQGFYEKVVHKATTEGPKIADMVPAPEQIKNFAYFAKADSIYQKQVIEGVTQTLVIKLSKPEITRMKGLINLRDKVRETLHNQLENKEDLLETDLKELNKLYDTFVKKYGFLHAKANLNSFEGDPDRPLILSLEHWNADKKTATKADIFRQRTMAKYIPVERVETAEDALIATVFDRGRIDFAHMSKISGKPEGALKEDLKGLIFLDPEKNGWQTGEEYLSGNVRAKLEAAKAAAEIDPKYKENLEALKKAQPEDRKPSQITARLGANWIPETYIADFLNHLLKASGYKPRYIPTTSQWVLEVGDRWRLDIDNVLNEQKWGIPDVDAISLITDALNLKIPTVYATVRVEGKEKRVIDRAKTLLAQTKQQEIKEEFERWIWEDTERRDNLAKIYNEKFNNIRLRKYAGEHLPDRLPGMAMGVALRPHQKDNTWRIIQGKNTLLAQVVGSGKTLSMTTAAMELRRLGLAKKPLFVVPKHLLKSWEAEFLKFYPAAKILVPEEKSLTPEKRQEFMARITTGDWDAVIITHPNMMKLPVSKKVQNDFIRGQIQELEDAISVERAEADVRAPSKTVKELEKAKKRLEEKLHKLLAGGEKDTGVTFEELGVDYMFIDESHNFKNLWFSTRMTRVAGVQSSDVEKTTDLFLKSRYLTELNNGRGVVFATGTPISNSMAEMYTIQRYLDMDALKELNIHNFDAWAATFGEIAPELEVTPTGAGFRVHTRFRNFVNMDQLSTLFREFADVLHSEDLPHLPVPKIEGGKPKTVKANISPEQKEYVQELESRMEDIRSGAVDPRVDNALVVTGDGTKAALDMRLINPALPDNPESKVNLMVNSVFNVYRSTTPAKSTQLVFCDFSTPKKGVFNVYHDVRYKLLNLGVPKQEIAFIHDYSSDDQKLTLFQKVREGDIRILMGSTKKMGEGMNVQNRLVAVHHLDAPWTPASVEQRDGRAIRPGNENEEVAIYRYVTQSTFDAYRWQLLENKAKFINQALKGGLDTVEDIGKTVIDYATAKAIAADNPIVMEKVKVESELRKYQAMHQGWRDQRYSAQREIDEANNFLKMYQKQLEGVEADLKTREPKPEDKDFSIRFHAIPDLGIKDATFMDKKEAGKEFIRAFSTKFEAQVKGTIGELPLFSYRGFKFTIKQFAGIEEEGAQSIVEGGRSLMRFWPKQPSSYTSEESAASTYFQEINKIIDRLDSDLKGAQSALARVSKKSNELTQWLKDNPEFEHIGKVKELQKRTDDINAQLRQTDRAVEEVSEVIPGQYYTRVGEEYVSVKAKKIEVMPWIDTFIHKLDDDTWAISEATTGMQIAGHHSTQERAKDAAWDILNRQGPEGLKKAMATQIEKAGPSPWMPEPETRLAMAGERAIGAPTGALAKAQDMLAKGEDEKDVWKETGWMRGVEGKWKWEIDDSGAKITDKIEKLAIDSFGFDQGIKLKDFLEHPALFKAYPNLKALPIKMELGQVTLLSKGLEIGASYSEEGIEIRAKNLDQAKDELLHEIQHAIQEIEGFARGGMPEAIAQELVNKETRYLEETNETYKDLSKKLDDLYFAGEPYGSPRVEMYQDQMQTIFDKHLTKKYGKEHPSLDLYKRLAGEIEAREVGMRKGLTPWARRLLPPYAAEMIPREDWIIKEGEGTSFSVEPALVAEPRGYEFTPRQTKNLVELARPVEQWLKRAGADKEVLDKITVELKPFIDLRGKEIARTVADWSKEGIPVGKILGATTINNYHALIQLAINGQRLAELERSTYHEWYHIAKAWMLPQSDINALRSHFKTEEGEADAFSAYMKDAKTIVKQPSLIKRLFLKLKRMINIIRNGLKGRGFNRPEDIFGKIRVRAYKPVRGVRPVTAVGLKPETRLAIEKKPPTKEEKAAEEYIQKALGKVRETKVVELKPTEEITGPAYDKIVDQEAQKPIEKLIEEANNDERLVHHVRSTLKKAMSIGKKEGIAKQKAHYQQVVARAKARKEQIAKIRKMVDALKKVDVEKMSPQEAEPIKDLLAGLNLVKPTKRTVARLTRTREYLEKDQDTELPEYVMESLKRLDKRNIRDMSMEEIEAIHTGVMHYVHLNQLKNTIKVRRENRRKAEVLASSISEMKAPKKVKSDIVSSQKGKAGKLKKTAKLITDTFGIRHDHYDLIIESLSGVNSTIDKVLYQDIKDGITEQLKYKQETYAQFMKDVGDFSTKYGIDDIGNWLNEEITVGKFQFTRAERMTLLRHSLNMDNLRHLLAGGFGFRSIETPNKVYKISTKELNQVLQSLTPAEKHFAIGPVNNLFEEQYKRLNKVFYQKNGYPLPKTKDPYYPIEVMPITLGTDLETVDALEKFKGIWTRIGLEKGMLEKRVRSRKPIYLNSIVFDINRSVMKSAAYIGLEMPLSNASKLLYDQTFRGQLENRYGKQTWREIEKGLRDIAGDYQSYTTVEEMALKLKNNLAVAMLGVNPFVMTKQVLSLPIYLPYVKVEYLLQGMIDFTVHPIELSERHKMYSPEYLERVEGGYSRDVADVFKAAAMKRLYAGQMTVKERFMSGIKLFDRVAVSAGMQGAVLQVLDEFAQGKLSREVRIALDMKDADIATLTPAEKMNLAYKFADYATERTQPMFSMEHRSSLSRGATIEKLATMFGSFTNQALNLMRRTYREARRTGEPAAYAKLAKALFLILVVNTLGVMAIDEIRNRLYRRKDRPSIAGRILNTWAGYMFFVRDLATSVISKVERGTFLGYDVELPVQRIPELLSNAIANGVRIVTEKTHGKKKKAALRFVDDSLNLLLTAQGIPYQTPKKMLLSVVKPKETEAGPY